MSSVKRKLKIKTEKLQKTVDKRHEIVYNKLARLRKADEIKRKPNQEGHVRAGTDKGD